MPGKGGRHQLILWRTLYHSLMISAWALLLFQAGLHGRIVISPLEVFGVEQGSQIARFVVMAFPAVRVVLFDSGPSLLPLILLPNQLLLLALDGLLLNFLVCRDRLSHFMKLLHQLGPLGSSDLASFPFRDHRRFAGFAMPIPWNHVLVVIIVSLMEEIATFKLCFGGLRVALSFLVEQGLAVNGLS